MDFWILRLKRTKPPRWMLAQNRWNCLCWGECVGTTANNSDGFSKIAEIDNPRIKAVSSIFSKLNTSTHLKNVPPFLVKNQRWNKFFWSNLVQNRRWDKFLLGKIWSKISIGTNLFWVEFGQKLTMGQIFWGTSF